MKTEYSNSNDVTLFNIKKVIVLFVVLYIATTLISSAAYSLATPIFKPFRYLDPDNCFMLLSIHHIIQAIITFALIFLIAKVMKLKLSDFGFNTNDFGFSFKKILVFSGVWFLIQLGASIYVAKTTSASVLLSYPLTTKNFIGNFLFEILLTGTSEEILFRSLTIPLTIYLLKTFIKSEKTVNIIAITMATLIFALAHVNYNLSPFMITRFNLPQLITCLIFGSFFGYLFVKTKSVLGPLIAHNAINGVITLIGLIIIKAF